MPPSVPVTKRSRWSGLRAITVTGDRRAAWPPETLNQPCQLMATSLADEDYRVAWEESDVSAAAAMPKPLGVVSRIVASRRPWHLASSVSRAVDRFKPT